MTELSPEKCGKCGANIGRAGRVDYSSYCDCDVGPLCLDCWNAHRCEHGVEEIELPPFEANVEWLFDALVCCGYLKNARAFLHHGFCWYDVAGLRKYLSPKVWSRMKRALIKGGDLLALSRYLTYVDKNDGEVRVAYRKLNGEDWDD